MPTFKSKSIDVGYTDKAHKINLSRHEPIFIPKSMCECKVHSEAPTKDGKIVTYSCTIKQWYIDQYPKMLPLLQEKELIWDVEM